MRIWGKVNLKEICGSPEYNLLLYCKKIIVSIS